MPKGATPAERVKHRKLAAVKQKELVEALRVANSKRSREAFPNKKPTPMKPLHISAKPLLLTERLKGRRQSTNIEDRRDPGLPSARALLAAAKDMYGELTQGSREYHRQKRRKEKK